MTNVKAGASANNQFEKLNLLAKNDNRLDTLKPDVLHESSANSTAVSSCADSNLKNSPIGKSRSVNSNNFESAAVATYDIENYVDDKKIDDLTLKNILSHPWKPQKISIFHPY